MNVDFGSMLLSIALALSVAGCGSSGDEDDGAKASPRACEQMREHLIDVRLGGVTGASGVSGLDAAGAQAQREALRNAMGDFAATCQRTMTRKQVACAMAASDTASLAACDGAAPK